MHKGIIAFVIVFIAIAILYFVLTSGLHSIKGSTTTILSNVPTTITTNSSTISNTTTLSTLYLCSDFEIYETSFYKFDTDRCLWTVNSLGLWIAAGNSSSEHLTIVGANNVTYMNKTTSYSCVTFFKNLTLPHQIYTINFTTGPGGGSCGPAIAKFNDTTTPPSVIYSYVYNGNFTNGEFTGWNVTGAGFGTAPMSISYDDNVSCYQGTAWSGYAGDYFASTYHCGISASPGNLTSGLFTANKPFLNFKIISPQLEDLYVEILYNNKPVIIAHYDTFNTSLNGTPQSTFRNASIPLTGLADKDIQVRVVSTSLQNDRYISVTGFTLSSVENQQNGILANLTVLNNS
jgi:hypothetical protein